jgi:hypothetical protein
MAAAVKAGTVDVNGATLYLHRAHPDVVSKAMLHEAPLYAGMSDPCWSGDGQGYPPLRSHRLILPPRKEDTP